MKFTKTYGIFLFSFLFGCFFAVVFKPFYLPETEESYCTFDVTETSTNIDSEKINLKPKLEVIDEVRNGFDEESSSNKIKLLETGKDFHGDEVKAKSGEKWLGLFPENDKFILKSTKLKIKRVHDGILDNSTKEKTGKSVSVSAKIEPLFLLKNSKLQEGEVETVFRGNNQKDWDKLQKDSGTYSDDFFTEMKKNFSKEFELGNEKYSLKVIEALNKENEKILALVFEGIGTRQVLHTITNQMGDEGYTLGTVHWIGDLDKDGKPDIYFSPFVHYNVENKVLLLSSKAREEHLLGKVAYFWTTGC